MNVNFTPPPERKFPETRLQQQKEQLLSRIQAEQRQRPQQPRRRRRWGLAIGAATAVAAAAIAVVALLPASRGGPSNATAAVLNRLARLVAAQPLTPQSGQYLYVDSRNDYPSFGGNCETFSLDHRQIWIGTDGSGLIRETHEPQQFTSAADRATCLKADPKMRLQSGGTSNDWFAPQCLELGPTNDWNSLSSDPYVLLQQMRQLDGGPTTPGEDFVHIGDFLRETDAPPTVRATLYRAAALIPGIQLLGTVRDHDGRPGLGFAYTSTGQGTITLPSGVSPPKSTSELIFDPNTGELLGEQQTGVDASWAVYLREKVVNNLPSKPPAPLTPPCTKQGSGYGHQVPGGSVTNGAPVT